MKDVEKSQHTTTTTTTTTPLERYLIICGSLGHREDIVRGELGAIKINHELLGNTQAIVPQRIQRGELNALDRGGEAIGRLLPGLEEVRLR